MAEAHVLSALKEKRARLAGELKAAQWRMIALRCDLASVDDCLRLFASEIDPDAIPVKSRSAKARQGFLKVLVPVQPSKSCARLASP